MSPSAQQAIPRTHGIRLGSPSQRVRLHIDVTRAIIKTEDKTAADSSFSAVSS
jgi:hypothetical protein